MNKEYKRTLVIGDIHGGLKALTQVLDRAGVNQDDHVIFLGDYVDGWSDSAAVISYLQALGVTKQDTDGRQVGKTTFIKGNHDDLVRQWLEGRTMSPMWLQHGGQTTIDAYAQFTDSEKQHHLSFYNGLLNYYIDSENRMYCHAGFQNLKGPEHEWHDTAFFWDRTLWEMVCAMRTDLRPDDPFYPKRLKRFKEIYIGHTPVTRIGANKPVQKANVWNIDTGAAFKGTISALDVDSKQVWQSDPVWQLYPQEAGRN